MGATFMATRARSVERDGAADVALADLEAAYEPTRAALVRELGL